MLSIFPELFTFALLAPLVLRLVVGYFLTMEGVNLLVTTRRSPEGQTLQKRLGAFGKLSFWYIGLLEIITGAFLSAGLFTQLAAIAGMVIAFSLGRMRKPYPLIAPRDATTYRFVFVICFALLFLGAGALGFDLPL